MPCEVFDLDTFLVGCDLANAAFGRNHLPIATLATAFNVILF